MEHLRGDAWHWLTMLALAICDNMNEIMALILFLLNAVWLSLRIYGWFKDREERRLKRFLEVDDGNS